jgi:hypothetical protein
MTRKLFLLAAAVIVIASCTKKDAIEQPSFYEYEISAASADLGTKTTYAGDKTFAWTEGDKISVLFHKGTDNKFFTFSTKTVDGASATFAGMVESGYEIGASDTGAKWALYPAGAHKYNAGETNLITFNIPAENDLSGTVATNIPLSAKIAADASETTFTFYPAAAIIKIRFTGIEKAAKVKLLFEEQYTHAVSGDLPMKEGGYVSYWEPAWADLGSSGCKLAITEDVVDGNAEFYIPFAPWDKRFKPSITLVDAATEDVLYSKAAQNFLPSTYEPLLTRMVVLPEIKAGDAKPWSFPSQYGIDWNEVSTAVNGDTGTGYDAIVCLKAKADATNLYVYFEIKKDALYDDSGYSYSNNSHLYIGDGSGTKTHWAWTAPYVHHFDSWLKYKNAPRYINWNAGFVGQSNVEHTGKYCYEVAIGRSSYTALAGSSATLCFEVNQQYVVGETWMGEETQIGFAPARWAEALVVPLP